MNLRRSFGAVVGCVAALSFSFLSSSAHADEATADVDDDARGVRFRGGVAGELGAMLLVSPGEGYGVSAVRGHAGVQVGDTVGVYASPYVGFMAGIGGGPVFGSALLVDFTFADLVSVGIGPELASFDRIAGRGFHDGAEVALRLHVAVYPDAKVDADGRRGFAVGADLRVIGASYFDPLIDPPHEPGEVVEYSEPGPLMLGASVFVGYEVF